MTDTVQPVVLFHDFLLYRCGSVFYNVFPKKVHHVKISETAFAVPERKGANPGCQYLFAGDIVSSDEASLAGFRGPLSHRGHIFGSVQVADVDAVAADGGLQGGHIINGAVTSD